MVKLTAIAVTSHGPDQTNGQHAEQRPSQYIANANFMHFPKIPQFATLASVADDAASFSKYLPGKVTRNIISRSVEGIA